MIRTAGTVNGALAAQSLAAGASVSFTFDLSSYTYGEIRIDHTAGASTGGQGLSITFKAGAGATVGYATQGYSGGTIPAVASTLQSQTYELSARPYTVTLTNNDTSNAVTVAATLDTYA